MKRILPLHRYACLLLAVLLTATPATASHGGEDAHKLALQYDVYAGGFKALNASLVMDLDKKAYDMDLKAETQGFIGSLFPWKGSYTTAGRSENGQLIPSTYKERSTWRKGVKTTEMQYSPNGKVLKKTVQDGDKTTVERDIDEALSAHALDMLTGVLALFQNVKSTQHCEGTFPIFDGKRRFDITLQDAGNDTLAKSKYSSFEGDTLRCTLTVKPVAGFSQKDKKRGWLAVQNHTEQHKKLPTIWLATLPGSKQIVPVRMEIASDYGAVVAHLSKSTGK